MLHSLVAATVLGIYWKNKTKQKAACGRSGGNPPWLPPTALFPTEAVVTVESVCDALSNGGAIDLRQRRLSPLAWPWLREQIDADRQKPDLDPLYVTSARENRTPPPFPPPTAHLNGHFICPAVAHPLAPLLLCRPQSSCESEMSCWHVQIEVCLHAGPRTICHLTQNKEDLSATASKSSLYLLSSPPFAFTFPCFSPFTCLTFFVIRCQGIAGSVFQFIIAFAPPLGSSNINDSLILCNKGAVMNWQVNDGGVLIWFLWASTGLLKAPRVALP